MTTPLEPRPQHSDLRQPLRQQSVWPSKAAHLLFVVALFLVAVVPRAVQPVSRPLVWYLRSAYFIEDVLSGNWGNTVYSEHPGVTLMWPAGIGLNAYWAFSEVTPAASTVPAGFEPIHFRGPVSSAELTAALGPLAVLIGLGIVGVYLMLRRLFGQATATVAGMLLALSPYYLAQSKVLHLDAPMATLMLLSALALLMYRQGRCWRWLLASGVCAGLALLTKIPAVFLIPFSGLVLVVDVVLKRQLAPRDILTDFVVPLSIWLITAALVYTALWPAMWVEPRKALAAVGWGVTRHSSTAHDSPTLFLGEIMHEDPGPFFYAVSLLFRMSEVELAFLIMALVAAVGFLIRQMLSWRKPPGQSLQVSVDHLLLVAYAVAYLTQMSLGAKKMPRYILPALLVFSILSAAGIQAWASTLAQEHRRTRLALMALPVLLQAGMTLFRHPYYGTALNWLAGGPPAGAEALLIGEEGEGYAELASHLNALPEAEKLTVVAQLQHVFNQTFDGTVVELSEDTQISWPSVDYLAFHRNYTSRDYKVWEWGHLWERYAARTPEGEVVFDGVPYAWLYPRLPADEGPEHSAVTSFGDRFILLGYDLRGTAVNPGDQVPVVLYWQATEEVSADLSIFVHLLDASGQLIWQDDGAADHGERPTWSWGSGEIVLDPHTVVVPPELPVGDYRLITGLYDWRTGERLSAVVSGGGRSDHATVTTLSLRQPAIPPKTWLARALTGLVLFTPVVVRVVAPRSRQGFLASHNPSR